MSDDYASFHKVVASFGPDYVLTNLDYLSSLLKDANASVKSVYVLTYCIHVCKSDVITYFLTEDRSVKARCIEIIHEKTGLSEYIDELLSDFNSLLSTNTLKQEIMDNPTIEYHIVKNIQDFGPFNLHIMGHNIIHPKLVQRKYVGSQPTNYYRIQFTDGVYVGIHHLNSGVGKILFNNGDSFEGQYTCGVFHDQSKYTFKDGSYFRCQLLNGNVLKRYLPCHPDGTPLCFSHTVLTPLNRFLGDYSYIIHLFCLRSGLDDLSFNHLNMYNCHNSLYFGE